MKLLITTQAVDSADSVLGFFVRWIEEFAKHCEQVTVICLREGTHALPQNVRVVSLRSHHKLGRALELLRYIVVLRREYDAVFVHMNPEYLLVAGWLWNLLGKKMALWYAHGTVNTKLRAATAFARVVLTSTPAGFRLPSSKLRVMGQGIDTDFFSPNAQVARGEHLLSVGRLTGSKRHDLAIRAAAEAGKELFIAGEGPEQKNLEALAQTLGVRVRFLGGLTQAQLRDEYRRAALLVHRSQTGSLDKVVLEALACGLPVDSADANLRGLPLAAGDPTYVRERHSLKNLVPGILKELS